MVSPPVTVSDLIEIYGRRLSLHWLAGRSAEHKPLGQQGLGSASVSLVGHLNLIHPHRVQVFSQRDVEYLSGLSSTAREDVLNRLVAQSPAALVVADGQSADATLLAAAEAADIPLIATTMASEKVITYLRYYLSHLLAERITLHGVFMEVMGTGVLLTGAAAVGKSELALELITRGHRLVADDAPVFTRVAPDILSGSCPELLRDFLEVRGLGLLNIRAMFGDSSIKRSKFLRLVVHLEQMTEAQLQTIDRLHGNYQMKSFLEVEVPQIALPVAPGRNLAVLVEVAVRNHILKVNGYNAALDFIERQRGQIEEDAVLESDVVADLSPGDQVPVDPSTTDSAAR